MVRQRAGLRCEYCGAPEGIAAQAHQVEHILARKHGGLSAVENLAWACFQCNLAKGSDVAAYDDETGDLVPLFNPRAQRWEDHFRMEDDGVIFGISAVGRATGRLLRHNEPRRVAIRSGRIEYGQW